MATTRPSTRFAVGLALSAAAVLAAGVVSLTARPGSAAEPLPFWTLVGGVTVEVNQPQNVDDLSGRADAIVLAHVTGVVDGTQDPGYEGLPATAGQHLSRSCYVQLTVDRVVKGGVAAQQVLNLEMHTPPWPLGLQAARDNLPREQFLFFLHAPSMPKGRVIDQLGSEPWHTLGSRSIVSAGQDGLLLPLSHDEDLNFVRSFGVTTLPEAADRAAEAVR